MPSPSPPLTGSIGRSEEKYVVSTMIFSFHREGSRASRKNDVLFTAMRLSTLGKAGEWFALGFLFCFSSFYNDIRVPSGNIEKIWKGIKNEKSHRWENAKEWEVGVKERGWGCAVVMWFPLIWWPEGYLWLGWNRIPDISFIWGIIVTQLTSGPNQLLAFLQSFVKRKWESCTPQGQTSDIHSNIVEPDWDEGSAPSGQGLPQALQ